MISVRRVSDIEYDVEVTETKLVSARIPRSLYLALDSFKNKSEFIRNTIYEVIDNNIDLTNISLDNENRNKVITFRIEYEIYNKMLSYAKRYESLNDFVNRCIWWGLHVHDQIY